MKIIECSQLSSAWFQAHCGAVTASSMAAVLGRTLKGEPKAEHKTYFRQKLAEMLTGIAVQDNYVSKEMLDGIEREPMARAAYELGEQVMVETIGFALHDSIPRFGCSPDGLVGDDGGVELKCPKPGTHLAWILGEVIPDDHIAQIDTCMAVTGRPWWDFCSFCPFVPKPLQTMVIRRQREEKAIAKIERATVEFNAGVDRAIERLRELAGGFDLPAAMEARVTVPDDREGYLTDADFEGLL